MTLHQSLYLTPRWSSCDFFLFSFLLAGLTLYCESKNAARSFSYNPTLVFLPTAKSKEPERATDAKVNRGEFIVSSARLLKCHTTPPNWKWFVRKWHRNTRDLCFDIDCCGNLGCFCRPLASFWDVLYLCLPVCAVRTEINLSKKYLCAIFFLLIVLSQGPTF